MVHLRSRRFGQIRIKGKEKVNRRSFFFFFFVEKKGKIRDNPIMRFRNARLFEFISNRTKV